MPPKCKFTKEEVIAAALALVREEGAEALTARALGKRLGSSSRPIFSLFESMSEVQSGVLAAADALFQSYLREDMAKGEYPPYKASGMAYLRFAREEKSLFRLLFMRDRTGERTPENFGVSAPVIAALRGATGLSEEDAMRFHLEIWLYVHGIAATMVSAFSDWREEELSRLLTDGFRGFLALYRRDRTKTE